MAVMKTVKKEYSNNLMSNEIWCGIKKVDSLFSRIP